MTRIEKRERTQSLYQHICSKRSFYILFSALVFVFVSYAYLIAATTINTAEAREYDSEIKEIMSDIATLEVEYLAHVNDIDMEYASLSGFQEVEQVRFVYTDEGEEAVALLE